VTFGVSGFAYRLGSTCFVKNEYSFKLFWGWLVGFSCASVLLQLVATGYCIWVYVASHRRRKVALREISGQNSRWRDIGFAWMRKRKSEKIKEKPAETPLADTLVRNLNVARKSDLWRGIRSVITLQWRIIVLCVALVIQGLYFCTLTWAGERKATNARDDPRGLAFGRCLVFSGGDRQQCFQFARYILVNKSATLASLGIMSVSDSFTIVQLVISDPRTSLQVLKYFSSSCDYLSSVAGGSFSVIHATCYHSIVASYELLNN
jgi:hypothetical protein